MYKCNNSRCNYLPYIFDPSQIKISKIKDINDLIECANGENNIFIFFINIFNSVIISILTYKLNIKIIYL